ncbi:hypothetical protein MASR2M39_25480 [Ignavibacteriales bacterium]
MISPNGYTHVGYIHDLGGQGVASSSNNGVNWTTSQAGPNPSSSADLLDKNHMTVDKIREVPMLTGYTMHGRLLLQEVQITVQDRTCLVK